MAGAFSQIIYSNRFCHNSGNFINDKKNVRENICLNGLMNKITPSGLNNIMNNIIYNNISPSGLKHTGCQTAKE